MVALLAEQWEWVDEAELMTQQVALEFSTAAAAAGQQKTMPPGNWVASVLLEW